MIVQLRSAAISLGWTIGLTALFATLIALYGWSSKAVVLHGNSEKTFTLNVDFNRFRQILVRGKATQALVEHGGMKLVNERISALSIDLSKDSRPLLHALVGESKADVHASKRLTVDSDDPRSNATQLSLNQDSHITASGIHVCTKSSEAAGELQLYETTLDAVQDDLQTVVTLSVDMSIEVRVSLIFVSQAETRVQQAAIQAVLDQESAIRKLISTFEGDPFILPKI